MSHTASSTEELNDNSNIIFLRNRYESITTKNNELSTSESGTLLENINVVQVNLNETIDGIEKNLKKLNNQINCLDAKSQEIARKIIGRYNNLLKEISKYAIGQKRIINIPWVLRDSKYKIRFSFSKKEVGVFTGKELIQGAISLSLIPYGQEIIEITKI